MRVATVLLFVVGVVCSTAAEEAVEDVAAVEVAKDEVSIVNGSYILTKHNFDHVMETEQLFIIYVYVPWCGHCQAFAPIWAEMAEKINNSPDHKTKVFSANVEENPAIHDGWHTTSFPTIYYVRKGEHTQYANERSEATITKFIEEKEQEPVIKITLAADLEDAIQSADVAIVGEFTSVASAEMFDKIAWNIGPGSTFFQMEESQVNQITVHSQHAGKPRTHIITDLSDMDTVKMEIYRYRRPFVIAFSRDRHMMTFEDRAKKISVLLFHDADEGSAARLAEFNLAARTYSNDYSFIEMKMEDDYVKMFTSYFGVEAADTPIIYLIDHSGDDVKGGMTKTTDLTESGVAQLVEDWRAGTADKYKPNSEQEKGEDWTAEHVMTLTDENFESVTHDPESQVFVLFYRPSCPHCTGVRTMWEELAEKFAEHPTLKIAQISSGMLSKVPNLEEKIEKVPTLKLYKGTEESVEFDGRTLEEAEAFLVDNVFNVVTKKDEL